MALLSISAADAIRRLADFDTIIDARSPAEYADDRVPGAANWPSLDDDERRSVGTEYVQVSSFEARKHGAAIVARRIAEHLEAYVADKPPGWKPLVYCWRGGKRSGTLAWFLDQIGFRAHVLSGGYKAFRAAVMAELETLPARLPFAVVCGRTGSGKTRLLGALREAGEQVLDLEDLAKHRGSVLGSLPDTPQPTQKAFDTLVWHALSGFDPARPVYVESESAKVGNLRVPPALIQRMREHGRCIAVDMPDEARVQLLLEDYAHFTTDAASFNRTLDALVELRGRAVVGAWQQAALEGRWAEVFGSLMRTHYDPIYLRSMERNFAGFADARRVHVVDGSAASMAAAVHELLQASKDPSCSRFDRSPLPGT